MIPLPAVLCPLKPSIAPPESARFGATEGLNPLIPNIPMTPAFIILTLYKVFVYIVGLFSGIAFAIWLRSRL
jgi:hypothetical protein